MNGILPLWKEKGMTSHDCVFKVRKILRMKKVGHTGTLDPDVEGVLPICLGRATKIAEYITDAGKEYIGEVTLGTSTTTEDASGEVIESVDSVEGVNVPKVLKVLKSLEGDIEQTPPMYSAVKVNGKKLYEYARAGIEVERPTRRVKIYSIELQEDSIVDKTNVTSFKFKVKCSKGTYIRTLAVQIGERLGFPAHMSHLVRTQSATFTKDNCVTLNELQEKVELGLLEDCLYPLEHGISYLPHFQLNDTLAEKVKNGGVFLSPKGFPMNEKVVMVYQGQMLAIYQPHPSKEGMIKPVKVIMNE
ncbi:tRNA pseudouridine synthase B [Bacillus coahuilensis p1.1.43]|uniref:tRNA pseudouridine synthase B n=1 Tax=Bacillus coahuilensis p1.1.43 TaxID=1150625 RepID=A0A147K9V5_9BACI|nr:tRNA pseudouridine(55) synthase TruB [Bacillus coahuilensis]KUP07151.1 tRNA pseudouridine synthase B [Bacillus coahuilensis p1.1.43]